MPAPEGDLLDSPDAGGAAIRGGALRVVGYALGIVLSLGSAAVLFRHLGVEDGGRYVSVQALALLAAGITDAGLTIIAVREYATRSGAERDRILRDLLGLRLVLTLVGVLVAVAVAAAIGYDSTLVAGTAVTGVAVVFTVLQNAYGVGLQAQLRLGWVTAADVLRQAATAVAVVVLVVLDASLLELFLAAFVGNLVALVFIALAARGTMPLRPAFHLRRAIALLRDTLVYAIATAIGALYFRLAVVLVSLIATADETGYFGASFRGVEALIAVPALLVGTAFPILARAARDDHSRLAYALGRILDVSLVLGVGVAVALVVGAPVVIDVVAGAEFAPAADVLRIHGVGLVASFLAAGWGYAALGLHLHRGVLYANLGALVACVVLVPTFTATWGATGAAVATATAEVTLAVGNALIVHRAGVALTAELRAVPKVLLSAAAAVGVGVLSGLPALPGTLVAGVIYLGLVIALRALPREIQDHLPGPLGTRTA